MKNQPVPFVRAAALFCLSLPAWAQLDGGHVVQPGDTLYGLAQRYLDDPGQWRRLQSLNQVRDPLRLMPGRTLVIPAAWMRAPPAQAEVLHVSGQAIAAGVTPLVAGQRLAEGARVEVAEGGHVSLRLADGSVLRLATGTAVQLRELRHEPASGRARSVLQLERGRVDATVTPLRSATGSRFEVRTPLAVGGVRGTTFGVAVGERGEFIGDVIDGAIQVQALSARAPRTPTLVRAGEGARVGAQEPAAVQLSTLLPAPDLSPLPALAEDVSWIELPLPTQPGAVAWQVRISSDDAGQQVLRNASFAQPLARFATPGDGDYRVAVRAVNAQGMPGGEAVHALRVNAFPPAPLLLEPTRDSRLPGPDIELRCTEASGVEGYQFEVASSADFRRPVATSPDTGRCVHTVRALTPGRYLWRVASVARDAQGQRDLGPFSAPVPFTVVALPPVPQAPAMRAPDSAQLNIHWGASPGGPWRHRIQIASDANFAQPLVDLELAQPAYSRAPLAPGRYFVRVRQLDADGLEGAWSAVQRLEIPTNVTSSDARPVTNSEGLPLTPGAR
ncbi:MAG: FecR domain-containing protein [Hydrogenophaga sp.]|uniref:FecR domain-containing protein n=1 Tax=Hydrogenophaga sp. TaxID=1904254 RepID=UPI003D105BDF